MHCEESEKRGDIEGIKQTLESTFGHRYQQKQHCTIEPSHSIKPTQLSIMHFSTLLPALLVLASSALANPAPVNEEVARPLEDIAVRDAGAEAGA
jgi:hypothetical protein